MILKPVMSLFPLADIVSEVTIVLHQKGHQIDRNQMGGTCGEMRKYKVFVGKPKEKRQFGRLGLWESNNEMYHKETI
jgi:hypothetical protein